MVRALSLAAILSTSAAAAPALAASSIDINITAHVDVFCQIYPPSDNQIKVVNGAANIGSIKEICNAPNGYEVLTSFSNLTSGQLAVNDGDYAIDEQGTATRSTTEPAVQTMTWRLAQAQLTAPNSPVVMRVTISPR